MTSRLLSRAHCITLQRLANGILVDIDIFPQDTAAGSPTYGHKLLTTAGGLDTHREVHGATSYVERSMRLRRNPSEYMYQPYGHKNCQPRQALKRLRLSLARRDRGSTGQEQVEVDGAPLATHTVKRCRSRLSEGVLKFFCSHLVSWHGW